MALLLLHRADSEVLASVPLDFSAVPRQGSEQGKLDKQAIRVERWGCVPLDILQHRLVALQQVGHVVALGQHRVAEERVGLEVELQREALERMTARQLLWRAE